MSHLFTRRSLEEEEKTKNLGGREEIIKEKDDFEKTNQDIDECGIYDFYPNAS